MIWPSAVHLNWPASSSSTRTAVAPASGYESGTRKRANRSPRLVGINSRHSSGGALHRHRKIPDVFPLPCQNVRLHAIGTLRLQDRVEATLPKLNVATLSADQGLLSRNSRALAAKGGIQMRFVAIPTMREKSPLIIQTCERSKDQATLNPVISPSSPRT